MKSIRYVLLIGYEGDLNHYEREVFSKEPNEPVEDLLGRINEFATAVSEDMEGADYDEHDIIIC